MKHTPTPFAIPPPPALEKVFNERDDAFDTKKVDGDVEDEVDPQVEAAENKKKRMYALKAHLEHEFDAVSGRGSDVGGQIR